VSADTEPSQPRARTHLAWLRTALAATVVSLLAARFAIGARMTARGVVEVTIVTALWLAAVLVCHRRIRTLTGPRPVTASRYPALLAALVVGYAIVGALIVGLRRG
jgi:uncharacterized membrane protein YidH (DUF202 family)